MPHIIPAALAWLQNAPCFTLYRRPCGLGAIPVSPRTGLPARILGPTSRATWAEAASAAEQFGADGIALMLYPGLGVWCLNVDYAFGPDGWTNTARAVWDALPGCPCELSRDGAGLHFFGRGDLPDLDRARLPDNFELYDRDCYITLSDSFFDRGEPRIDHPDLLRILAALR